MYERGKGGELIPAREMSPETVAEIERADDQAIVEAITQSGAQQYFAYAMGPFKTKDGEKWITGISVNGANEIARRLGNIESLPDVKIDKDSDEDYVYAIMRARDLLRNVILSGAGRACKYQLGERNEVLRDRPNAWWFVQAVNKAQRNSILAVAPQEAVAGIMEKLDPKLIKKLPVPPSYPSLSTAPAKKNLSPVSAKAYPAKAAASPPVKSTVQELGYIDEAEQLALRKRLADLLTIKLAMTREQAIEFVNSDTTKLTKAELEARVKEAEGLLETYQASEPLL